MSRMSSFRLHAAVVAFAASASLVGAVTSAQAAGAPDGPAQPVGVHKYTNGATGKCLDVRAASRDDGAVVQQFNCKSGEQQKFATQFFVGDPTTVIRPNHSGKCVDTLNGQPGAGIIQRTCNNTLSQRWEIVDLGNNAVSIKNVASGLCLDDGGMPSGSRREVRQVVCLGSAGQIWSRYAA
ncbi:RICIN domain-containing protein [Streptomyces netropsis]|uniref:Ricin B lectin domain-containing protein n=1 Tax=Streptomyces netropsis TaxID=55404 RepID=A0A7W7LD63_STRNE|nr:RICIN domain-containing protein [Streptomyces netropsis]MBB4888039.1 hypothetical protein [Streptomyces netropsis]GGR32464.1 hypothetical protein GCM10010219_41650 [Streptomyces netropsis]